MPILLVHCLVVYLGVQTSLVFLPGPKTLFLDRYYFHPRGCVCVCVCLSVNVYLNYLKKFLTDFYETWQDD